METDTLQLEYKQVEHRFLELLPQFWQQSWSHWEKCKNHHHHHHHLLLPQCHCQKMKKVKLIFSVRLSRYLCTRIFVMSQQLPSDICLISDSQIIIGILSVLSFIIPHLNCNGLPSFTTVMGSCRLNTSADILNISQRAHSLIIY